MNRLEASRVPVTGGARLLMLVFVGLVLGTVALRVSGATLPESVAVGAVVGLLLAVAVTAVRPR